MAYTVEVSGGRKSRLFFYLACASSLFFWPAFVKLSSSGTSLGLQMYIFTNVVITLGLYCVHIFFRMEENISVEMEIDKEKIKITGEQDTREILRSKISAIQMYDYQRPAVIRGFYEKIQTKIVFVTKEKDYVYLAEKEYEASIRQNFLENGYQVKG